jgi:hypothetical protein
MPRPSDPVRSPLGQLRLYGAFRTTLITYGVAAFSYILSRPDSARSLQALGGKGSAADYVLGGLLLQAVLLVARVLVKRYAPDRVAATQGLFIVELIGDGATVLLFALGTLGAILHAADDI